MQGRRERSGGLIVGGFGLAFALLMLTTLVFEGSGGHPSPGEPSGEAEVAVFYLERSEWRTFAKGVEACVGDDRRLGRLDIEDDDWVRVRTARHGRPVRFTWRRVRGESQARDEVCRLDALDQPPVAVVGSSNTLLTEAVARQLRVDSETRHGRGPLLLVPWATSVGLIGLYPGRTFRFCPNNTEVADLVVDRVAAAAGRPGPDRAMILVDQRDPYSRDLADCFRRRIAGASPGVAFVDPTVPDGSALRPEFSGRAWLPTAAEQECARAIWRSAAGPGSTWVVLPLQREPARRMIAAINGAAPAPSSLDAGGRDTRSLTLICGDAIGQTTLADFLGQVAVPTWSVATASTHPDRGGLAEDVEQQAEIVAAILIALDSDASGGRPSSDDLLRSLQPGASPAPAPFGRPLAFGADGERRADDPGEVVLLTPGAGELRVFPDRRPIAREGP